MALKNKKIIWSILATDHSNGPFFWARTHQSLQGQKQEKEKENYFIKYLHTYLKILMGHHFGRAIILGLHSEIFTRIKAEKSKRELFY